MTLAMRTPTGDGTFKIIEKEDLFHKSFNESVTGKPRVLSAQYLPQMPTDLKQASHGTAAYEAAALTIEWKGPTDIGCLGPTTYAVQATLEPESDCCWQSLASGISALIGRVQDDAVAVAGGAQALVQPGVPTYLRVLPSNPLGPGEPSDRIRLTPAALPGHPGPITVAYPDPPENSLILSWSVPADTGGGDQSAVAASTLVYRLEVDEGFYDKADGSGNFVALTTAGEPTGPDAFKSTTYKHKNLIVGHTYTYRVKAHNLMGYGAYSPTPHSFIPRIAPGQPTQAPRDRPALKTRSTLFIEFDAVLEDGGSPITAYNVYIDDGQDNDAFVKYPAGALLLFDTQSFVGGPLALTAGRTYRVRYSATNAAGLEGPLSAEVSILLAERPSAPTNLERIRTQELPAGQISIRWDVPADSGGTPVTGYVVYKDGLAFYNSSDATFSEFTLADLTVGRTFEIAVSAWNRIGEGPTS
jgi:titin